MYTFIIYYYQFKDGFVVVIFTLYNLLFQMMMGPVKMILFLRLP